MTRFLTVGLMVAITHGVALLPQPASAQTPEEILAMNPYDETADASRQIAEALARAGKENKRVLIQWGANWCGWCKFLDHLMETDRTLSRMIAYEYEKVLVDIGRGDKHQDVAKKYGAEIKGVPYLTILDANGNPLTNQQTVPFEKNTSKASEGHDPAKLMAWLTEFQAEPLVAADVLQAGLEEAKRTDRRVLLHSGAPWCGWCKRLETWLERPDIAPVFSKDFVGVKIDVDRMTGGRELMDSFSGGYGGVPWLAILDPDGTVVTTSMAPNGRNIGSPQAEWEIEHWNTMMLKSAKRITEAEIAHMARTWAEDRPPQR
jgi:thiol-disulfide isomerase/thioredoxin